MTLPVLEGWYAFQGYTPCFFANGGTVRETRVRRRVLNEFYKKGCQEKSSSSTGGREDFCLDIQPTVCKCPPRFRSKGFALACLPFLTVVISDYTQNPPIGYRSVSDAWSLANPVRKSSSNYYR